MTVNTWTVRPANRKSRKLPAMQKMEYGLARYLALLIRNLGPFLHVEQAREAVASVIAEHGRGIAQATWFVIVGYEDFDGKLITIPARIEDTTRGPLVDG